MKKDNSTPSSAKKKKRGGPLVFLLVALFLLISALVLLRFSGIGAAPGSESFKQVLSSTQLMQNAKLVKQDLKDIVSEMKDNDITALEFSSRKLDADVAVLNDYLSTPIWSVAEVVPVLGQDVKTAKALVDISEAFSDDLLKSWIDLQKTAPYTELKTEEGYNDEMIAVYLDYLEDKLPTAKSMVARLEKLNLRLIDEDGKISSYIRMAAPLVTLADEHFDELIRPGIELLLAHHPSELRTENGFRLEEAAVYYDFLSKNFSQIKSTVNELSTTDLSLIDKNGKIGTYISLAQPLLEIVERYDESVISPAFALLAEHPLSGIKTEAGINYDELGLWSDYLLEKGSSAEALIKDLQTVDLSPIDRDGKLSAYLTMGEELLEIGIPANEKLLRPALQLLHDRPLSSFKVDGGFDVRVILDYLDFAEENMPLVEELADKLEAMDRSRIDLPGKLEKYFDRILELRDLFHVYEDYIPAVRVVLAEGKDRLYLFPAQNSAEIRASGGFPGSVGFIEIHDGILSIQPFMSVYSVLHPNTAARAKITQQEVRIFTERMYAPRDVDFCPDFERVAQIWSYAYTDLWHNNADGIISATPVIIQKLLSVCDEPIVLSNGMTLDGNTATRVIQRDIYFEYKRAGMNVYPEEDMTDILFEETVQKTMSMLTSDLDAGKLLDLCRVIKESIDERIIMMWMADEDEEEIIRQAGWSGSLNTDPEDPKLGIFFSSEQSGKMGYFLDMIPSIGEPVVNDDGSRTYDVTLTLNNVVTKEEQRIGGTWILGRNYVGSIVGDLTLTAPAGGTISDTSLSIPRGMRQEEYHGLDTHYIQWLIIERNSPITVTFKVTTAPDVETPLGIIATPTLTNYRPK